MSARADFKDFKGVSRFILSLSGRTDKSLSKTNSEFMERVKKGAKNRAPVDTHALRDSIKLAPVRKGKNVKIWKLLIGGGDAQHAIFQEQGFAPHSVFVFSSMKYQNQNYKNWYVKKYTPFVLPAFESQIQSLSNKMESSLYNELSK